MAKMKYHNKVMLLEKTGVRALSCKTAQIPHISTELPEGFTCPREYMLKYLLSCDNYIIWRTMENGDIIFVQDDQPKTSYDKYLVVGSNESDCKSSPFEARQFIYKERVNDILPEIKARILNQDYSEFGSKHTDR